MGLKISGLVKFTPNAGTSGANLTVQNASYSGTSFSVGGQIGGPAGISFNPAGTRMFILDGLVIDSVHQYTLGTGFDLSTASWTGVSFNVSSEDTNPRDIFFNPTGTKMFIAGVPSDRIHQYTLSTGFDLSTASYDNISKFIGAQSDSTQGIFFNPTGTKMFICERGTGSMYQYSLGTGFDLSTASYDSVTFDVSNEDTWPNSVFFNSTGTRMFVAGNDNDTVYQYSLGTGFDLSTASYDNISFDVSGQENAPSGIFFNPTGTKMFMVGASSDSVYQYDL